MRSVINFLRGSVCVAVSGPFPERFLNLCAQSGVGFWDLAWEGGQSLRLRVLRRDAGRAVELAERAGCTASLEGRAGLPVFLAGFRRRYALLAGLALALAAVCLLSQFILTVEVSGNETVPSAVILMELSRQGVRPGAYGPGLDLRRISQEALRRIEGLSWMSVNLHGTRAEVLVRERSPSPTPRDETTPAHVVAAADGVLEEVEVLEGQALFREGQAVLAGEIVISGAVDLKEPQYAAVDAGQRLVHARGEVWAVTHRTLAACIPLEAQVKVYTGEEERRWSLSLLGRSVNFFGKASISSSGYDKMTTTHILTLPGGREMPLVLVETEYRAYETAAAPVRADAARAMLEERLLERLTALIGAEGSVLSTAFSAEEEDGMLTVTLTAQCREQIGREAVFDGRVGEILPGTQTE
ncbi:MAG TPA: sporulation protein YqfD [Candidatus Intestinimonas stercorigallinarum]|nr:sporulation protein YqfD [Candidatus Intestinimonas stercorigallinarum]